VASEIQVLFLSPRQHLLAESIWIVQRKGLQAQILGQRANRIKQARILDMLSLIIDELKPVATQLNCLELLLPLNTLETRGTSADRQLAAYERELSATSDNKRALYGAARSILLDFGYQGDPGITL
jgi:gamma-glutamyl:cysteine ligase YbdK (ATP-grasp superfamily)